MTGFGVATIDKPSENINLEIKSLNSRNLDIRFSGLNISADFEQKIKKIILKSFSFNYEFCSSIN